MLRAEKRRQHKRKRRQSLLKARFHKERMKRVEERQDEKYIKRQDKKVKKIMSTMHSSEEEKCEQKCVQEKSVEYLKNSGIQGGFDKSAWLKNDTKDAKQVV